MSVSTVRDEAGPTGWASPRSLLVDGRNLSGFGATRGFGRYLRALLTELGADRTFSVSALVDEEGAASTPDGIEPISVHRRAPGRFVDREHRIRLPFEIAAHQSDIFHSPGHDPPPWCGRPWVQTLHDVPLSFTGADGSSELRSWQKRRRRVRTAAAVIAVSRYVADRGIAMLGLEPERMHVAMHGVSGVFSPSPGRPPGTGDPATGEPYLLFVSEYGPHKGYAEAFEVISRLAERGHPHRLVVVGRQAPWWRPVVDQLLARCAHPELVEFSGLAEDEALATWYRGADALIITSRAEGFGLPAVEAMACGTPVIAFDNTALPEVIADGGVLVPDGDTGAFAAALDGLISSSARWREAGAAAHERSRAFTWEACAAAHVAVFNAVLAQSAATRSS